MVPYRIDVTDLPPHALETLIDLGALDVEPVPGGLAALMPDAVAAEAVTHALGAARVRVSAAAGRDDESVWALKPRPVRTRTLLIVPAAMPVTSGGLQVVDGPAFGTGHHETTALCLNAIDDIFDLQAPACVLDVGVGSGILSLLALRRGAQRAVGLDIDAASLRVARENAVLNGLARRLSLVRGGPAALRGAWPLVLANIRAAELMKLAPVLVRRVASGGWLVLSGIPLAVRPDVEHVYRRLGMTGVTPAERGGWVMLMMRPSW